MLRHSPGCSSAVCTAIPAARRCRRRRTLRATVPVSRFPRSRRPDALSGCRWSSTRQSRRRRAILSLSPEHAPLGFGIKFSKYRLNTGRFYFQRYSWIPGLIHVLKFLYSSRNYFFPNIIFNFEIIQTRFATQVSNIEYRT